MKAFAFLAVLLFASVASAVDVFIDTQSVRCVTEGQRKRITLNFYAVPIVEPVNVVVYCTDQGGQRNIVQQYQNVTPTYYLGFFANSSFVRLPKQSYFVEVEVRKGGGYNFNQPVLASDSVTVFNLGN